jgi:tetratricopeptide (TPR) repeat protein
MVAAVICCIALALVPQGHAEGSDSWVGQRILIKRPRTPMFASIRKEQKVIARLSDILYLVYDDRESFVQVRHGGVTGWLPKDEAVLLDEAIAFFTGEIRKDNTDARAYALRARAYLERGDYDCAFKDSNEAILLQPKAAPWRVMQGDVWLGKKEYAKALADYDEAIRLDPEDASALCRRGYFWWERKDLHKAVADYDAAIRLDPKNAELFYNRGTVRAEKRDFDEALDDFTEAICLDPQLAKAFGNRGNVWLQIQEYDKALADYCQCINLDAKDARAFYGRGRVRVGKKVFDRALADYDEAIRLDPKYAQPFISRARLLATCPEAKYRDGKRAVESARRGCELTGWKDARYLHVLASAYAEAGNFERAVKFQKKSLDLHDFPAELKDQAHECLKLYEAGKPYRLE